MLDLGFDHLQERPVLLERQKSGNNSLAQVSESQNGRRWKGPLWVI